MDIETMQQKLREVIQEGEFFTIYCDPSWRVTSKSKAAAIRVAKEQTTYGRDDVSVIPMVGFYLDGVAYGPVKLYRQTPEDMVADIQERQAVEMKAAQAAALERARALGLSDEDIKLLGGEA